ncbi:KAP family NTPase [Maritalea mobilis]|uniref:KAP family P-loop NTPase fold protein n=1 Tax=Maritalea mobilis TaxID=483324 RepID=UPI001C93F463|nr:P-loop NTPase fold protein [Maritalea mobilis]MBY6202306.1 KAP family NTPase [Maritalea mobilis]
MTNARLTLPEPEIDLYQDGFDGVCQLDRASEGKKLSNLVEAISEPMVIAVDAPWGAGKSVFLKCWVGAHAKENNGTAKTVYFDAFKNDFMDDPLIGLTGTISERIETTGATKRHWENVKKAAFKLARPALKIGLALATAGATEVAGVVGDAGLNAGSDELEKASEAFWKKEDGRRAAMQSFREALEELAAENKLVIVVDELDRCRPDYALNLLEVIKHFFDVPNVHFVLGVNLKELANSVRARYGVGVQADRYLQKFVTLSMPLVPRRGRYTSNRTQMRHFQNVSEGIGLFGDWKYNWLEEYLQYVDHHARLSLRDVEKIATLAMVTPEPSLDSPASPHFYIGLLVLQVLSPSAVESARQGKLTGDEFFRVFELERRSTDTRDQRYEHHVIWRLTTSQDLDSLPNYLDQAVVSFFPDRNPREILRSVIAETLDVFQL